ncbi:unnamed protein product [Rhizoctonia solani]|uniref:Peptidase C14 caspase domain-containing protein n=1 Tax=Rhizoctonia solani TaxID=456999 RepID=A0A8H2WR99_9AGAM|nr:unnamed protein product [Rhizoctonia solani]
MSFESPLTATTEKAIIIEDNSEPTLYALVIGINAYRHITPLKGAVNDADEMSKFLTSDLKIPSDHIINLRDETASRANIIQGFRRLRDDPRIKKGDPILVFYAGHGGSYEPSRQQRRAYGPAKIQVIFPHDYKFQVPDSTKLINCIPDKTVGALLNEIAAEKGNNLTVIFDCCHSASATRSSFPDDSMRQSRSAKVTMEIPEDIDSDIFAPKPTSQVAQTDIRRLELPFCTNQSSHIHFAACGDEEKAWEEKDRGAFTVALLKNIRACGVDKVTYHDLMISLPNLPRQSPHCYGAHITRTLFNARVPSRKVIFIPVKVEDNGALFLQAGAASGVTFRSIWEVYGFPTQDAPSLGRFYAKAPKVATVELKPETDGQAPLQSTEGKLYARQVGRGSGNELKVWFSPEAKVAVFESSSSDTGVTAPGSSEYEVGYVAHDERDSADVTVELDDSGTTREVMFHISDPRAEEYGVATLNHRKPAQRNEVEKVLFAVAKWHWHLHRTPENAKERVTIDLVKLPEITEDADGLETGGKTPTDSYQVLDSATGVVDLVVEPDVPYGVRVTNSLNIPLYLKGFYFNLANFAIYPLLGTITGNARTDPELPPRSYVIIGRDMGNEITFTLEPGIEMELGYFKLFWSTDPLELDIEQDSPFDQPIDSLDPGRELVSAYHLFRRDWGTSLLALVQRAA